MESGKRPAPKMADLELTAAHSVYSRYWRMGYAPEVLLNARDLSLIPGVVEAISNFYTDKYDLLGFNHSYCDRLLFFALMQRFTLSV